MKIDNLSPNVKIKIYNVLGQLVAAFENNDGNDYEIWYGRNALGNMFASGVYIVYLKDQNESRKMKISLEK